jgi:WD40 repeat protein
LFGDEEGAGGGVFAVEIERRDSFDPTPVLQITPAITMARVEVSGRAEGPFIAAPAHMNVPTLNEVACGAVPFLVANRGSTKLWVRGTSEEGNAVAAVEMDVDVPPAVRWKTFEPATRRTGRSEAENAVELKFEPPNTYTDYYIDRIVFSPDGERIAAMIERAGIVVWDVKSGRQTHLVESETGKTLVFSEDGSHVTNGLTMITLNDGASSRCLQADSDTFGVAVTASFKVAATVNRYQRLVMYNLPTDEPAAEVELGHEHGFPNVVSVSPNGELVAVGGPHVDVVWLVDRPSGNVKTTLEVPKPGITSLAFSPDSVQLLAAGPQSTVKLWSLATGEDRAGRYSLDDMSPEVIWTNRGDPLVADIGPAGLTVFDARTGKKLTQVDGRVEKFAISPTGTAIAIAGKTSVTVRRLQ